MHVLAKQHEESIRAVNLRGCRHEPCMYPARPPVEQQLARVGLRGPQPLLVLGPGVLKPKVVEEPHPLVTRELRPGWDLPPVCNQALVVLASASRCGVC